MRFAASIVAAILFVAAPARAASLNVFACEPEWAALAGELGGDNVEAFAATTARQDPHQIQARPALIAHLRRADLAVCTGAELEIGWMPVLLRSSANGKVQPGAPGYFEAAQQVHLLEIPAVLDRSLGDIHPSGNPHIQDDPHNIRGVAVALSRRLAEIDGTHAAAYAQRLDVFLKRWDAATAGWEAKAAPLKGTKFVSYHREWIYLATWLGMQEAATIEPKPGIPPGSAYLAQLLDEIPRRAPKLIVYSAYQDSRASEFVAKKSGLPLVMLPYTVGGTEAASTLFGLFDDTVARLLAGLETSRARQ